MAVPNITPGDHIPSGYLIGRVSPGTGRRELISIADLGRQIIASGVVAPVGASVSLASITGTGLVVDTGSALIGRTITGTADKITVTDGDGIAGNPTLTIAVTYAGQASITTLGTIATGTWNATVITGQYGGTGVANTGKTITLGGNLVTAGAFATTFTVTADTNSTLPSGTHTLAGLDVAQTWSAQQTITSSWLATYSSSSSGINASGGRYVAKNTDATANNWVRAFQALASDDEALGQILYQVKDHTNHEADFVISARANGAALALEGLRLTGTNKRLGIGGSFATNEPQATLHVGLTAATARAYNLFTDTANGEWSYMGSWGVTANVATFGTGKNGTGATRNIELVIGDIRKLDYGIATAGDWTIVDDVNLSTGNLLDAGAAPTGTAGSGYVRKTSPTLTTPNIGAATGTSLALTGGVVTATTAGSSLADQIYDHDVINSAQFDKTSDTTFAGVTGLSCALVAGKTYVIEGWLSVTSGAAGGLKMRFGTSGGLTATAFRANALAFNGTTIISNTTVTTVTGTLAASNAVYTDIYIKGSIIVNAGGNLFIQFAQNTSDATTSSVLAGSTLGIRRIN